jgi:asparaginyl-tRNA synthetase
MRETILQVLQKASLDRPVQLKGWVRSVRRGKKFSFLVINDGSCQTDLQVVADANIDGYEEGTSVLSGAAVMVEGTLVASQGKGQSMEVHATKLSVIGPVDESYPLQKKATSLEFLREQAHLRIRTQTFGAVFRVRHALAMATHEFFSKRGFFYVNTPIITAVDAEGAGEMFGVSTLDKKNLPTTDKGEVDYSKDYFAKETSLCVTGQLEGECYAMGLGAVYTFGPTFRSENSNTPRHLAEFWMIEPEVAFAELEDVADLARDYIQFLIRYAFDHCPEELAFLHNREGCATSRETLEHVRDTDFKKITYTEAMEILSASGQKFEFPTDWGRELQTEHERYLTDVHFKGPVIVTDYPKDVKAFYMKLNPDQKTVRAMDVLVPGVGEIIGGSQREDSLELLEQRMDQMGMQKEPLWWYLDLRRFGSVPHAGFGLGFERAIMYITGMTNIRDVIAFPRTPKNCDF